MGYNFRTYFNFYSHTSHLFHIPLVAVYPREPGGLDAFKNISFHATPTVEMVIFVKNAGYAPPPLTPSASSCVCLLQTRTLRGCLDALLILRIFQGSGKTVEHQFLYHLPISRICSLSLHQDTVGHQVGPTDHTSRKVRYCDMVTVYVIIMKHVMTLDTVFIS